VSGEPGGLFLASTSEEVELALDPGIRMERRAEDAAFEPNTAGAASKRREGHRCAAGERDFMEGTGSKLLDGGK